jgi:hypothetical protein
MFDAIRHFFRKPRRAWFQHDLMTGKRTPVGKTDAGKLFAIVGLKNECPDCHRQGFHEEPPGGRSAKLFCGNRDCRSVFNVTWFDERYGMCQRVGKGDLARYSTP